MDGRGCGHRELPAKVPEGELRRLVQGNTDGHGLLVLVLLWRRRHLRREDHWCRRWANY